MPADPTAGRATGIPAGKGSSTGAGRSNTYGAMPHNGGSGRSKERDDRHTWLTEDDDEVWRPKDQAPKTNSAGAIE
jgi:hypothetical protein